MLPLLGLLRADGKKLSMIIVPQSLFESVSSDTQRILSDNFGQSLKSLHFSRNTKFNKVPLERIRNELMEIIEKKECLIITSKSIQCFLLKFIEESFRQEGKITSELRLMREILTMIRASHPIIDEIDTVLNVLHEVCFSTGNAVCPKDADTKLISEIYDIIYTDPEIKKLVRIESDPQTHNDAEELTEKNFPKVHIAEKILKLPEFKGLKYQSALYYLCRNNIRVTQAYFNELTDPQKNALALASEQLNNFLPHTLTKNCNEKYGLDGINGGNIAIPYAAVNTPTIGSQFANPYITMNYTFQYYIKRGIPRDAPPWQVCPLSRGAPTCSPSSRGKRRKSQWPPCSLWRGVLPQVESAGRRLGARPSDGRAHWHEHLSPLVYVGGIEVAPGKYDWADYDRMMDLAAKNGIKVVIAEFTTNAPEWAFRQVRRTRDIKSSDGSVQNSEIGESTAVGGFPGLCLDNPEAQAAAEKFLTALIVRYRNHPALLGYDLWNENTYAGGAASKMYCYCEGTKQRLREWLRTRYGSLRSAG